MCEVLEYVVAGLAYFSNVSQPPRISLRLPRNSRIAVATLAAVEILAVGCGAGGDTISTASAHRWRPLEHTSPLDLRNTRTLEHVLRDAMSARTTECYWAVSRLSRASVPTDPTSTTV